MGAPYDEGGEGDVEESPVCKPLALSKVAPGKTGMVGLTMFISVLIGELGLLYMLDTGVWRSSWSWFAMSLGM